MTILIVGAAGFIGQHCIQQLLYSTAKIHCFDLNKPTDFSDDRVVWHEVDIFDVGQIEKIIKAVRPTHLLNLAWYMDPKTVRTSLENIEWIYASYSLMSHFLKYGGKKIVVTGSGAEYGGNIENCSEESTALNPQCVYGASKVCLHKLIKIATKKHNAQLVWTRIFSMYGPGEKNERIVPSIINAFRNKQNFNLQNPYLVRDYIYVEDAAVCLTRLLLSDLDGSFNVASGESLSFAQLYNAIARVMNGKPLVLDDSKPRVALTAQIGKVKTALGWQPAHTLKQGLIKTIKSHLSKELHACQNHLQQSAQLDKHLDKTHTT